MYIMKQEDRLDTCKEEFSCKLLHISVTPVLLDVCYHSLRIVQNNDFPF